MPPTDVPSPDPQVSHKMQHHIVVLTHANTNLIASFHKFADIYSEGNAVVLTRLGFSKTFEMVPHSKLLAKIEKM